MRAHATAVLSLLGAVPGLRVYDGQVPNNPVLPYVVLYIDSGTRSAESLSCDADTADFALQTTSVGATREQAQWAAERAMGALLDARPVVSGWLCGRVRHAGSQPTRRDDDVDPPLMYATDQWRFLSTPA